MISPKGITYINIVIGVTSSIVMTSSIGIIFTRSFQLLIKDLLVDTLRYNITERNTFSLSNYASYL